MNEDTTTPNTPASPKPQVTGNAAQPADQGSTSPPTTNPAPAVDPKPEPKAAPDLKTPLLEDEVKKPETENQAIKDADEEPADTTPKTVEENSYDVHVKQAGGKHKLIIIIVAVIAVLSTVGFVMLRGNSEPEETAINQTTEPSVSNLTISAPLIEGVLQYSEDSGQSWKDVDDTATLAEGSWVRTDEEPLSRAVVAFSDQSEIRLSSDTLIEIASAKSNEIRLVLRSGQAYSRVSAQADRTYTVTTTNLEIEALGTAFRTSLNESTEEIDVFESSVSEKMQDVKIEEGRKFIFDSANKTAQEEALDIEQLKLDEFIGWNRMLDAENDDFKDKLGFLSDLEPPSLNLITPANDETVTIEEGRETATIEFSGTTEPSSNVTLLEGDEVLEEITAGQIGEFNIAISKGVGEYSFTVTSTDKSGNVSRTGVSIVVEPSEPESNIVLAAVAQPGVGVALNWTYADGFEPADGIQVVWSTESNPTFPIEKPAGECNWSMGSELVEEATNVNVCLQDGRTYNIVACNYTALGNSCSDYSNRISIQAPVGGSD